MPLSISLGSVRLRPVALGGSNARIMERICSQRWSGISRMVSSIALLPIVNPRPFAAYPNLKLVSRPSFEIVSKPSSPIACRIIAVSNTKARTFAKPR